MKIRLSKTEFLFLFLLYLSGLFLRLYPRLSLDPHLLTFEADIWYRLCLAQYVLDHGALPVWDIRYEAYGQVPLWYNIWAIYGFAFLSKLTALDLPTVCSRFLPFLESFAILPMYFLCRRLYGQRVAVLTTLFLQVSPAFVFWTGICSPQSFTLFMIPVIILLWVRFLQDEFVLGNKWLHLSFMGGLLALNFLLHLTVFNLIVILLSVHLAFILESRARAKDYVYLLVPILLSQILTAWWWLPNNLYWWWTQVLTTSSAFFEGREFLHHYGFLSGTYGHLALLVLIIYIARRHRGFPPFFLVPVVWALFPMAESHNEGILRLINRSEWTWVNLVKPLEGFRFYCFLAQPLAICVGLSLNFMWEKIKEKTRLTKIIIVVALIYFSAGLDMMQNFNLFGRFRNPSMEISEIRAAHWFRNNSKSSDRILTEYFTAQMLAGICGGRTLLGSMFPLKNVDIPYITEGWRVQTEIYSVYVTDSPGKIAEILKRYRCTHVFFSKKVLRHIEAITKGDTVLEDISGLEEKNYSATLFNPAYFKTVYEDKDVRILEWIGR